MHEHSAAARGSKRADDHAPWSAVIGLREVDLVLALNAAVSASGYVAVDVVASPRELLAAASFRRPTVVVATLDVLGSDPLELVRRLLVRAPGSEVVVLAPPGLVPVWPVESGVHAIIDQTEIGELKLVLRRLRSRSGG